MLKKETIIWLSEKQKELDSYILKKQNLKLDEEILKKKIIAFVVELGEYNNEERDFKFWSKKPSSDLPIQLDEYIDGLHFIISIGNQIGYNFEKFEQVFFDSKNMTEANLLLLNLLSDFIKDLDNDSYEDFLSAFLQLAEIKKYSEEELIDAYNIKNKINFERQNNNY